MTRALEVAFRLATTLPSRVHRWEPPTFDTTIDRRSLGTQPVPQWKIDRMREMDANDIPRKDIAAALEVNEMTVRRKLGARRNRRAK